MLWIPGRVFVREWDRGEGGKGGRGITVRVKLSLF